MKARIPQVYEIHRLRDNEDNFFKTLMTLSDQGSFVIMEELGEHSFFSPGGIIVFTLGLRIQKEVSKYGKASENVVRGRSLNVFTRTRPFPINKA